MKRLLVLAMLGGVVSVFALASCAREHLTATHGVSTAAFYRVQLVNPEAGNKAAPRIGLDSTEAAIVAKNYYDSLAAEGGQAQAGEQILIVSPTAKGEQKLPPPSVPEGSR